MDYDLSRLDGDPAYAPGLSRAKGFCYWRPSPSLVKQGYSKQRYKLPGREGDGQDHARAALCRQYTRDMLRWASGETKPLVDVGTWGWLIGRYRSDEFSPFQEVKENTRDDYRFSLGRWEDAIGKTRITETDLPEIKRWQRAMQDNGRSVSYIKRMFTVLRIVAGYGKQLRADGARDVVDILSEMRIKTPKPRTIAPSEAQVLAVIAKADEAGDKAFALGIALQWWLTLRAVDVRGQYLGKGSSARWADGLTWDMIDRDITTLTKTPSKTEQSLPDALVYDLTLLPDVRARLQDIPLEQRVGPVIRDRNGRPYNKRDWARIWRKHANAAGLPEELKMMDTRAGALSHARRLGVSGFDLRDQANHASIETTNRYIRGKNDTVNNVIALRTGTMKQL